MAAAIGAMHLGADHAELAVFAGLDRAFQRLVEARPARTALELLAGFEQLLAAAGAGEGAGALLEVERAGAGPLRAMAAQDLVLLRRQPLAPLRVGQLEREGLVRLLRLAEHAHQTHCDLLSAGGGAAIRLVPRNMATRRPDFTPRPAPLFHDAVALWRASSPDRHATPLAAPPPAEGGNRDATSDTDGACRAPHDQFGARLGGPAQQDALEGRHAGMAVRAGLLGSGLSADLGGPGRRHGGAAAQGRRPCRGDRLGVLQHPLLSDGGASPRECRRPQRGAYRARPAEARGAGTAGKP